MNNQEVLTNLQGTLIFLIFFLNVVILVSNLSAGSQHSVARKWNDVLLESIRKDFARPTIHARNLFHISAAIYDAWSAYDNNSHNYFIKKSSAIINSVLNDIELKIAREESISYVAYRLLIHRFKDSPGADEMFPIFDSLFISMGYDTSFTSIDYSQGTPAALGNYIADYVIKYGLEDGSNELNNYSNIFYNPINPPLDLNEPGNSNLVDPNRWQPLVLDTYIDQSGHEIPISTPQFQSPEWGIVKPFALKENKSSIHTRKGFDYKVYHDPGPPPYIHPYYTGLSSEEYKWGFILVSIWSSHLDSDNNTLIDISPASLGNIQEYPESYKDYDKFYDLINGGDPSIGHSLNPKTSLPYDEQIVPLGDYARILAEFWADGPNSETPPGHWFTILNYVNDHPEFERKYRGVGSVVDELEWDVKSYFMLGGAVHDAAITAWGIKGWYDFIRPISAIRYMADRGQSSSPELPNFHPEGIPLIDGYIEQVKESDSLAGTDLENVNKIKLYTWKGHKYINDPLTEKVGVGWILAEDWWPYQRPSFVTPPFAGYVSGHSTFSRAAAEVLTLLTGDEYFPGGMGEFECKKNEFLVFEDGPSIDITLQWATYKDASDQCSLSRIWGGIHPPADDIAGRKIGKLIGEDAFNYADSIFNGVIQNTDDHIYNVPQNFNLSQNYPNPFNPETTINYTIPSSVISMSEAKRNLEDSKISPFGRNDNMNVRLKVYDILGREAVILVNENQRPGNYTIDFNGENLSNGVYFYELRFGDFVSTKKMIILK